MIISRAYRVFDCFVDIIHREDEFMPRKKIVAEETPAVEKVSAEPVVMVQSKAGGTISVDEIVARVKLVAGKKAVTEIYIKPEDNKAYYVTKRTSGSVLLWD